MEFHIHIPEDGKVGAKQLSEAAETVKMILTKDKDYLFGTGRAQENLRTIDNYQHTSSDIESRDFVRNCIPESDKAVWFSSLMLRSEFQQGHTDEVIRLKSQIVIAQGNRGKNIANLCSAGYLESLIMPLYRLLVTDNDDRQHFFDIYQTIITDYPFAVFVSVARTTNEIKKEIIEKIQIVKRYGWDRVAVHGIGRENVRRIQRLTLQIESECENVLGSDVNSHQSNGEIITVTFRVGVPTEQIR